MKNCDFLHDSARGVGSGFERPELRTRRFPHCDHFMARRVVWRQISNWSVAGRDRFYACHLRVAVADVSQTSSGTIVASAGMTTIPPLSSDE